MNVVGGTGAVTVNRIAGLGMDEHSASQRLQQPKVRLQSVDLLARRAGQQACAIPPAHQDQFEPAEQLRQRRRIAGKSSAEFDAGVA
jgi:hypothetical protein